ncbi:glucokinase [Mobilisporobacter senegalensis]|uniref:Glucokinase n=1 Tax=Mobilisporobacter senegalensis TaxID=1329262 RepID=A0A3N1XL06_9FIRM|nr:ROK family glucokinase [Mobilisporobacter senegalensis]ROR27393.1 glucokinase [Mobilisporobacter senegalensis]
MSEYCLGIDLGGTTTKLGLFRKSGKLIEKWVIPTDSTDNGMHILLDITESINNKLDILGINQKELAGVGIGIPGPVKGGIVTTCVNLGWVNRDVKAELNNLLKLPIEVGNDANVAALGEMWQGSGKGSHNLVMITLGTGVGSGIVIDEKIVSGFFGAAGEIGHMPILHEETTYCACGKQGCLEQVSSATGIVNEMKKKLECTSNLSVLKNIDSLTAKDIFDAARSGDIMASQVIENAGYWLGTALASITSVLDPDVYVIGGGLSNAGDFFVDKVSKYYRQKVLHVCKKTMIKKAELGNDAGIYGAARMVL